MPQNNEFREQLNAHLDSAPVGMLNTNVGDINERLDELRRRSQNAYNALALQSTATSFISSEVGAVAGGVVGAAIGGLPGLAAGAVWGASIGLGGSLYFKAEEIERSSEIDARYQDALKKLKNELRLYSESLYQKARREYSSENSETTLQNAMRTEAQLMAFVNDADLPMDFKSSFIAKQLELLSTRINLVKQNGQSLDNAVTQLQTTDARNQAELAGVHQAVTTLVSGLDTLSGQITQLDTGLRHNGQRLDQVSAELNAVVNGLEGVAQQLSNQELRLTNLEVVADVVFSELTKISTYGLEQHDSNIANLYNEYAQVISDPHANTQTILTKRTALDTAIQLKLNEVQRIETQFNTFFGITNLFMQFGQVMGSQKLQEVTQLVAGIAQVGMGIAVMAGVGGSALSTVVGGAALGPVGMVAAGVITLLSVFRSSSSSNGIGEALQQISQQIEALSKQVAQLQQFNSERFDKLENILFDQRRLILVSFRETVELLNIFYRQVMTEFMDTQDRLDAIEQIVLSISNQIDQLKDAITANMRAVYSQEYDSVLTRVVNYYDHQRFGEAPALAETEVRQAMLTMVNWATSGAKNKILHGDSASDYSLRNLVDLPPAELLNHVNLLLGILRNQGVNVSPTALAANVTTPLIEQACSASTSDTTRVVNPLIFETAVKAIMKLVDRVPEFQLTQQDRCLLKTLIDEGKLFLGTIQGLKTNAAVHQLFLNKYEKSLGLAVHTIYRRLVEIQQLQGAEQSSVLRDAESKLRSGVAKYDVIKAELDAVMNSVTALYSAIINSCYLCVGAITNTWVSETANDARSKGYCSGSWQQNSENQICSAAYERPMPNLPNTDCHNSGNLAIAVAFKQQVAQAIQSYWARSSLAELADKLSKIHWQPNSQQLMEQGSPVNLTDLMQFILARRELLATLNPQLFYQSPTGAKQYFQAFNQAVSDCWIYSRLGYLVVPIGNGNYAVLDDKNYAGTSLLPEVKGFASQAHTAFERIPSRDGDFRDALAIAITALGQLATQLKQAQTLRTAELYSLQEPNQLQIKAMLAAMEAWFVEAGTAAKVTALSTLLSDVQNQQALYHILQELDAAKSGLALYLRLAFSEEFSADAVSQLILKTMLGSKEIVAGLTLDANNTVLALNDINEQLKTFNTTVQTANSTYVATHQFLTDARNYLNDSVARGKEALSQGQLWPGYSWLVAILNRVAYYHNYIFPNGLSLLDFTPQRIFAAFQSDDANLVEALKTPNLDLVNNRDGAGNSVYLLAARECNSKVANGSYANGANVNALNAHEDSALNLAAQCSSGVRIIFLRLLLRQGVTACRSSDNLLYNAMLAVKNTSPELVQSVTCISLSSPPASGGDVPNNPTNGNDTAADDSDAPSNDNLFTPPIILALAGIGSVTLIAMTAIIMRCSRTSGQERRAQAAIIAMAGLAFANREGTVVEAASLHSTSRQPSYGDLIVMAQHEHEKTYANSQSRNGQDSFTLSGNAACHDGSLFCYQANEWRVNVFGVTTTQALTHGTENSWQQTAAADQYDRSSCRPLSFYGRDSVVCNGESTVLVYQTTPNFPQKFTDALINHGMNVTAAQLTSHAVTDFSSNFMLWQVCWHLFKKTYAGCKDLLSVYWYGDSGAKSVGFEKSNSDISANLIKFSDQLKHYQQAFEKIKSTASVHDGGAILFLLNDMADQLADLSIQARISEDDLSLLDETAVGIQECFDEIKASEATFVEGSSMPVSIVDTRSGLFASLVTAPVNAANSLVSPQALARGFSCRG